MQYDNRVEDQEAGKLVTSSFGQDLFTTLSHQVSPSVGYRLNFRAERNESRTKVATTVDSRNSVLNLEPGIESYLRDPIYDMILGYRLRQEFLSGSGDERRQLTSLDAYSRFGWRPDGLPEVIIRVDRFSTFDNLGQTERVTNDLFFGTNYTYKFLTMTYNLTGSLSQDKLSKTETDRLDNLADISFDRSFIGDRLKTRGFLQYNTLTRTSSGAGSDQEDTTRIWNGSFTINSKPFDKASLGYNLFFARLSEQPADSRDLFINNGLNFTYNYRENLVATAAINRTSFDSTQPNTPSTSTDSLTFSILHEPLKTLSATYSYNHSIQREEGKTLIVIDSGLASFSGQAHRDVRSTMDIALLRSTSFEDDTKTLDAAINSNITAKFTRKLSGNLNNRLSWEKTISPSISRTEVTLSSSIFLVYRVSPILGIRGNYEFSRDEEGNNFLYGIDLDWIPFQNLSLYLNYDQEFLSQGGTRRSLQNSVRWNIGRNKYLALTFGTERAAAGASTLAWGLTFNMRF